MSEPIAAKPRCDVPGCGMLATSSTTGSEVDVQELSRPAIPKLNLCGRHANWAHSEDAKVFVTTAAYRERT